MPSRKFDPFFSQPTNLYGIKWGNRDPYLTGMPPTASAFPADQRLAKFYFNDNPNYYYPDNMYAKFHADQLTS